MAPTARPTVAPTAPGTVADDEPNNTPATASPIAPGTHEASIAPIDDVDFFRIQVPDNTQVVLTLHADTLPGGAIALCVYFHFCQ